ncbi:hypothetical protein B9G98_03114 [Wickerhamiella sorbophila]|uniref:Cell wall protein n=1 Tax=Wickerhamiella sorbophila TaxID=45607 RepID=A0A2T0FKH0_9ASCO|nr:hypothetical protein B9G98_03114 [Wickerhamiella sorbophila]PRT55494.1 hypothetical protein B9G98_03114 [Wickerhamiella sorbophila]
MSSQAILLALLSIVSAQCVTSEAPDAADGPLFASITAVESNLDILNSLVQSWSKYDGILGAIDIQQNFYPLYRACTSLNDQAGKLTVVESKNVANYISSMNGLVAEISTLIGSLNEKANDMISVGAGSIVSGDIVSLAGPASDIEVKLFANLPSDAPCIQIASAAEVASNMDAAYKNAAASYTITKGIPEFPAAPSVCSSYCTESSATPTSSPATSSTSPTTPGTSSTTPSSSPAAPASSSPADGKSSTAPASSSPADGKSSTAPASSCPTDCKSSPAPASSSPADGKSSDAPASSPPADGKSSAAPATSSAASEGPCVTSAPAQPIQPAFGSSLDAVIAPLTSLNALVEKWSVADGLPGGLSIQEGYQPLYDAVMNLKQAAGGLTSFEADDTVGYIQTFGALVSDISALLGNLNAKAQDFTAVGAAQIVQNDISSLAGPASEIAVSIFNQVPTDAPCPVVTSAGAVGSSLGAAFSSAGATFSVPNVPEFPAAATACLTYCGGETAAPTGPAAPSTPPSSATAPAGNATTSGAPDETVTTVVTAFTTYCPEPTTLCPGNGKCYTVTEPTTLTVTDCPCTIPEERETTTTVVTAITTYCPEPTTLCPGNGKCYTVTEPTTLTVTDCPCTITKKEEATTHKVTAATTLTVNGGAKTHAPEATAPVATLPVEQGTGVTPANGASSLAAGLYVAVAGIAAIALL